MLASYPPLAGSSPCKKMCVCDSIRPGMTVTEGARLITVSAWRISGELPSTTATILLPRMMMPLSCRTASLLPSIRLTARIAMVGGAAWAKAAAESRMKASASLRMNRTSRLSFSERGTVNASTNKLNPKQSFDDGFGLDLHQHLGQDERAHLDHACRGADGAEELAVGAANGFPVARDVDHVHAGANDIFQRRPGAGQRALDVAQRLDGLRVRIADADNAAVRRRRRCASDVHHVAQAHRAR